MKKDIGFVTTQIEIYVDDSKLGYLCYVDDDDIPF